MTPQQLIQKEIDEAIAIFNERDEDTIAELIQDADLESTDFNIGFEQGYLRGLEVALSLITPKE